MTELCPICNGQMRTQDKVEEEKAYQSIWEKVKINLLVCDKCGHIIEDNFEFKLRQSSEKKES